MLYGDNMLYVGYWRVPGKKNALHGFIKADSEESAYDVLRLRLRYDCRITAIYKAEQEPTDKDICVNFALPKYQ